MRINYVFLFCILSKRKKVLVNKPSIEMLSYTMQLMV